jgi:hypothetical protein
MYITADSDTNGFAADSICATAIVYEMFFTLWFSMDGYILLLDTDADRFAARIMLLFDSVRLLKIVLFIPRTP